jgi:hypothetical protein
MNDGVTTVKPGHQTAGKARYFRTTMQFPKTTVGTVQSWFEEHEGELQHRPWPAQSPDLNIIEPLCAIFSRLQRGTDFRLQNL